MDILPVGINIYKWWQSSGKKQTVNQVLKSSKYKGKLESEITRKGGQ